MKNDRMTSVLVQTYRINAHFDEFIIDVEKGNIPQAGDIIVSHDFSKKYLVRHRSYKILKDDTYKNDGALDLVRIFVDEMPDSPIVEEKP